MFVLSSDDGSMLYIDGEMVTSSPGELKSTCFPVGWELTCITLTLVSMLDLCGAVALTLTYSL